MTMMKQFFTFAGWLFGVAVIVLSINHKWLRHAVHCMSTHSDTPNDCVSVSLWKPRRAISVTPWFVTYLMQYTHTHITVIQKTRLDINLQYASNAQYVYVVVIVSNQIEFAAECYWRQCGASYIALVLCGGSLYNQPAKVCRISVSCVCRLLCSCSIDLSIYCKIGAINTLQCGCNLKIKS